MDIITTIQDLSKCNGSALPVMVALTQSEERLIAAAPALLEALTLAVAILQEAEPRLGYAEGSLGQIEIEEAITTGLAALLQATGGENGR